MSARENLATAMRGACVEILGQPSSKSGDEWRWGTRGSLCVDVVKGTYYDHEAGEGGGVLDLLRVRKGMTNGTAMAWLRDRGYQPEAPGQKAAPRIVAEYSYTNAAGALIFQVCRLDPKNFRQRRPDGNGGWHWNMRGVETVLYRLPLVLAAVENREVAFIAEGEKGADSIISLGLTGTCSPGGASKWKDEYSPSLTGADVVILPDRDNPGRDHAATVARSLTGIAARVRVLELPDLQPKGDIFDWIEAGGRAEELTRLAEAAPDAGVWLAAAGLDAKAEGAPESDDPPEILTEGSVSDVFAAKYAEKLRFDHTAGRWLAWTGTRWQREETRLAYRYAHDLAKAQAAETDKPGIISMAGRASFAGGVERLAQADRAFAVTHEVWDSDSWLLGTPGGTVNLKTGAMRPADPIDCITKLAGVSPAAPGTAHPLWSRFLDETTLGDLGLQRFLQQVAGYCLTGDTREHALFFVYGPGGNGKSVFLNTLAAIAGDYATIAAMTTFTASQSDQHPTDLAKLAGSRLVSCSETEEGRAWAESRIKQMTGGDVISARFMRQDFFDYRPQFKLLIVGNHKPVLRNVDEAARRRFNIIPFVHKPAVPDKSLETKLRAELPAILRWAIDGAMDWQEYGLVRPDVVTQATAEYFSEQDLATRWMEDCCDRGGRNISDTAANLFASWSAYALANGEAAKTSRWLAQTLQTQGAEPVKDTPGHRNKRGFLRISVKPVDVSGQWQNAGGYDR